MPGMPWPINCKFTGYRSTCQKWVLRVDMAMSALRRLCLSAQHLPPLVPSVQLHGEVRSTLERASLRVLAHEPTQHSVVAGCLSLPLAIALGSQAVRGMLGRKSQGPACTLSGLVYSITSTNCSMPNSSHHHDAFEHVYYLSSPA